ncbi:hypothetical protein AT3G57787 [Arabidopsis thaliana]|uniref:Uncharacterized protein n=1 Tax=Arabidopsis thaliana TaxID=3702 RepID=A0A1I9LQL9_ARATH|nr:uncharacterized protein AT3G57787 [Arabidopsis thaliana]ANM64877.1 hypothetical protein AT3G57787 [Arabidopsis thaliana]|eukprot:NP_001326880.1 hypothetical protein AT3G57787 [Arabidopsis thaliana]
MNLRQMQASPSRGAQELSGEPRSRLKDQTHSEDYNREEACDVTWKLPIFPLARLSWRRRSPVHEISFGSFFVTRCRPPAWTSRCGSRSEVDPVSERLRCDNQWLRRRHFCDSDFTLSDILMIRRK